jgi:WD40 repeat protein
MVWAGASELGYLRVELRSRTGADTIFEDELVIKSTTAAHSATYGGRLVDLPTLIKTEPKISQLFVRTSGSRLTSNGHDVAIIATVSDDGTLRLWECGVRLLVEPCVLHPVN